jgi:hypothetical protein
VLLCDEPLTGTLPPALRYLRQRAVREARRPAGGRAVLAYTPKLITAARAFRAARGGAVVVIEAADLPLSGWAAEARAVSLLTGRTQPPLPPPAVLDLQRLLRSVDDGWLSPHQAEAIRAALHAAATSLTTDDIVGYLLAHGRGARAVRQVRELAREPRARTG